MDNKTVFIKTSKGEEEMRSKTPSLVGDLRRALLMVDGTATFAEISKRAAPSLRNILGEMFRELVKGGMIQDKVQPSSPVKMAVPTKVSSALKMPSKDSGGEELDFTSAFRAPSPEILAAEASRIEAEKLKAAAEAKARADAEAKTRQEHEAAQLRLQQEAAQRKAEQEAQARAEQEAKARAQAEAKAQQEAARLKAEQEAARVKAEAEARLRAEMERRAKAEAEAARLKADQEAAKAKAEAEAKAREEAERRAKAEAEAAKQKAEQEAARARAELEAAKARAEAKAREEAERRAKAEAEAARVKAEQLAEEARRKAEQEAAKAREEAERRIKQEMEAARIKAEQEAARARAELEAAKAKAEAEAKAREEAERRVKQEVEAAKQKAEQEAAKARAELEAAKAKAEQEAQARAEKEQKARQEAEAARAEAARLKAEADAKQAAEAARQKAEQEAAEARKEAELARQKILEESKAREEAERRAKAETEAARIKAEQLAEASKAKSDAIASERSTSATVLFFDVVGYTKQSVRKQIEIKKQFNELVSECLRTRDGGDHIILDTGDGAAIGFMQHPEDALEVAMQFRKVVMANEHNDYPDLQVRIGIHLGPIKLVKDMNGQSNMVGDGINDAQRVMSFAGIDEVYISRAYYDFVSRLSDEYATLFQYRGEQKDKHGREHQVYELIDGATPIAESVQPGSAVSGPAIKLEPFNFEVPEAAPESVVPQEVSQSKREEDALIRDMASVGKEGHAVTRAAEKSATAQLEAAQLAEPVKPAKPVVEVHMPTAEDISTLAAAQAKAWAEAEQRAREEAQAKAERDAQPQKIKEAPPVPRARRKPLPWGKLGAGVFLLAVIALFVVPMVLPMKDYASKIESMLSAKLRQPVHIGQMNARLLPTPRLVLSEVTAGSGKQLQASQAQVNFAFSAIFSDTKAIDSIELQGVQVNGAALQEISAWLQQTAADAQYPVRRIQLAQGKIEAEGISFSGVGGMLDFNHSGKFIRAKLNSEAGKFAVDIDAAPDNKAQVSISVRGTSLPLLPNWTFDELNAKGELGKDGLLISDFDARIAGGILLGDARLDWGSGWHAQGKLVAKTVTMQNVHRLLEGDMEGSANFQMKSANLAGLADNAVLDGRFVIKKGMIGGMDIVETARLRSRENMPGGRTHFDEFSGDLSYANGTYRFKQLKVTAGVLNATGAVDIAKQQVSGRVNAELTMRSGMGNVALQVGGTTETPTLRTAR